MAQEIKKPKSKKELIDLVRESNKKLREGGRVKPGFPRVNG